VKLVLLLALAGVAIACSAAPALATQPPRTCGSMSAGGHTYKVRSHLVACRHARRHARRILRGGKGPSGWSCRKFKPSVTRIRFICDRGARDFYAIRQ
jgi:hypothetical protein